MPTAAASSTSPSFSAHGTSKMYAACDSSCVRTPATRRGEEVAFAHLGALLREDRFELAAELGIVLSARVTGAEPRILREARNVERLAQATERGIVERGDEHPPVLRLIEPVERVQPVHLGVREDPQRSAGIVDEVFRNGARVGSHHPGLQRVAVAGAGTRVQRHRQRGRGHERGVEVGVGLVALREVPRPPGRLIVGELDGGRRCAGAAGLGQRTAADRARRHVEGRFARHRSGRPVGRGVEIDEAGVDRTQGRVVDPESLRHTGPEVVDQRIGTRHQAVHDVAPLRSS